MRSIARQCRICSVTARAGIGVAADGGALRDLPPSALPALPRAPAVRRASPAPTSTQVSRQILGRPSSTTTSRPELPSDLRKRGTTYPQSAAQGRHEPPPAPRRRRLVRTRCLAESRSSGAAAPWTGRSAAPTTHGELHGHSPTKMGVKPPDDGGVESPLVGSESAGAWWHDRDEVGAHTDADASQPLPEARVGTALGTARRTPAPRPSPPP